MNKFLPYTGILGTLICLSVIIVTELTNVNSFTVSHFNWTTIELSDTIWDCIRFGLIMPMGVLYILFGWYCLNRGPNSEMLQLGWWIFIVFEGVFTVILSFIYCEQGCFEFNHVPSNSELLHNILNLFTSVMLPTAMLIIGVCTLQYDLIRVYAKTTILLGVILLIISCYHLIFLGSDLVPFFRLLSALLGKFWILYASSLVIKYQKG